jgi:ABC-2 type transport system permease protein
MPAFTERLKHDWFILRNLVSKDFKLKYRRSILGVLWSVLNPFLMMVVMAVVFSFIFRGDPTTQPFAVYLILGNTLFGLMAASTTAGTNSIMEAAPLIKKIRVNKMIFPVEKVLFELVNFVLSLIAVAAVLIFYSLIQPNPNLMFPTVNLFCLPLLLVYILIFCAGLSLLLSALAVFFSDIIHLWGVVITAWTYLTPLFYPIGNLPDGIQTAMKFNPMYQYVNYFRSIVMWGQMPGLRTNLICLGMALITLLVGYLVFKATQKRFILFV